MPQYPSNPYAVVEQFEEALSWYTGAPYVVTVESCTTAIYLACKGLLACGYAAWPPGSIEIPKRTYVGVAQSIQRADFSVTFRDEKWQGKYQLKPYRLWDAARQFTRGMYVAGEIQCVSFHWEKILGIGRGGAILTDHKPLADWCRCARFDGRHADVPCMQDSFQWGLHAYMTPEMAAAGLVRLWFLPEHNADQNAEYPDLSQQAIFQ